MSFLRRKYFRKKLDKLLARTDDEDLFLLAWSIRALQSERAVTAARFLEFPAEAVTKDLTSRYFVHPWKLETLLNESLAVCKPAYPDKKLNCSLFGAAVELVNLLDKLENADDAIVLSRVSVLREMHRLAQRQFEWQRGFISLSRLYRAAFIYGGELARQFFVSRHGVTLDEFTLACFALRTMWLDKPVLGFNTSLSEVGLTSETTAAVLGILTLSHQRAKGRASELRAEPGHVAYKRSLFRQYPCVAFGENGERIYAPLVDLVTLRATSGVFYDVIDGGPRVRNEIGGRFESYCAEFLSQMLPLQSVRRSFKYRARRDDVESPDILITRESKIAIIFECKATRMAYEARFSEVPMEASPRGYNELAKGVFQIWRFISHCRRELVDDVALAENVVGVVLTLDTWLSTSGEMQEEVIGLARQGSVERDAEISDEDRIPVAFCSIEELELTLSEASEGSFHSAVRALAEEKYRGWHLSGVHQEIAPDAKHDNGYPFENRIGDVLPWWGRF